MWRRSEWRCFNGRKSCDMSKSSRSRSYERLSRIGSREKRRQGSRRRRGLLKSRSDWNSRELSSHELRRRRWLSSRG